MYLSAKFGHCFAVLGHGTQAEQHAQRSLDMDDRYVRGKVFNLVLLAASYLHRPRPEPEQAAAVGGHALALATDVRSARAVGYLTDLAVQLVPFDDVPGVRGYRAAAATPTIGPIQ